MNWEPVKIYNEQKGRNTPYASIGYGRISLNAAACELIKDNNEFTYAKLLKATQGKKTFVAIRFLKEYDSDAIKIKRKTIKGKLIAGLSIETKGVIADLFGTDGENKVATRYNVKKEKYDENEDILVIYKD